MGYCTKSEQKETTTTLKSHKDINKIKQSNKNNHIQVTIKQTPFQYFTDSDDDSHVSNPIAYIPDDLSFNPSDYEYKTDDFSEEGSWVLTPSTKARRILCIIKQ